MNGTPRNDTCALPNDLKTFTNMCTEKDGLAERACDEDVSARNYFVGIGFAAYFSTLIFRVFSHFLIRDAALLDAQRSSASSLNGSMETPVVKKHQSN